MKSSGYRPQRLLETWLETIDQGLTDAGQIGELVTQAWWILARDHSLYSQLPVTHEFRLSTVRNLLMSLCPGAMGLLESAPSTARANTRPEAILGKRKSESSEILEDLLASQTSFGQFVEIAYTPHRKELIWAFVNGVAFQARTSQPGADLIIPILLPQSFSWEEKVGNRQVASLKSSFVSNRTRFGKSADLSDAQLRARLEMQSHLANGADVSEERIGVLLIQSRNKEADTAVFDVQIEPAFCGIIGPDDLDMPGLAVKHVLLADPATEASRYTVREASAKAPLCRCLVIRGISSEASPCLVSGESRGGAGLAGTLLALLGTFSSPLKHISDLSEQVISSRLTRVRHVIRD